MKDALEPFANDSQVLTIGEFTVENGVDALVVSGDLKIRRDRRGLEAARSLAETFAAAVRQLEAQELPERAADIVPENGVVDNPFQ